jgi:hypothetical protein
MLSFTIVFECGAVDDLMDSSCDEIDSFIQVLRRVGLWARDCSRNGFEFAYIYIRVIDNHCTHASFLNQSVFNSLSNRIYDTLPIDNLEYDISHL